VPTITVTPFPPTIPPPSDRVGGRARDEEGRRRARVDTLRNLSFRLKSGFFAADFYKQKIRLFFENYDDRKIHLSVIVCYTVCDMFE